LANRGAYRAGGKSASAARGGDRDAGIVQTLEIEGLATLLRIKQQMKAALQPYGFAHYTIEVELSAEDCGLGEH